MAALPGSAAHSRGCELAISACCMPSLMNASDLSWALLPNQVQVTFLVARNLIDLARMNSRKPVRSHPVFSGSFNP